MQTPTFLGSLDDMRGCCCHLVILSYCQCHNFVVDVILVTLSPRSSGDEVPWGADVRPWLASQLYSDAGRSTGPNGSGPGWLRNENQKFIHKPVPFCQVFLARLVALSWKTCESDRKWTSKKNKNIHPPVVIGFIGALNVRPRTSFGLWFESLGRTWTDVFFKLFQTHENP